MTRDRGSCECTDSIIGGLKGFRGDKTEMLRERRNVRSLSKTFTFTVSR